MMKYSVPSKDPCVICLGLVDVQLVASLLGNIYVGWEASELFTMLDTVCVANLVLEVLQIAKEDGADKIGLANVNEEKLT